MTEISQRLRNPPFGTETNERNLMTAAADEIERLRRKEKTMLEALRFVQEHGLALKDSPMFEIVAHAIAKAEGEAGA